MMRSALCFAFVFSWVSGTAQFSSGRLTGKVIDPRQYDDALNSPYIFDTFISATLVPLTGNPISDVKVNFNGHTQLFELEKDGLRVEMDVTLLMGIQVLEADSSCGYPTFLKLLSPKLVNKYPLFLYQGRSYKLIKDFRATLAENKVASSGKTIRLKTYNEVADYYLMTGNDLQPIRLNQDNVFQRFPDPGLRAYVEANNVDTGTEQGMCTVLAWLESEELRTKN